VTFTVVVQPEAEEDLLSIADWLAQMAPGQGGAWYRGLEDAIASLESRPRRCALAPENVHFADEIRQRLFGKGRNAYRILFTIRGKHVHVLHVRRCAQRPLRPED
jgi:plasmid stabilization system protein ParE